MAMRIGHGGGVVVEILRRSFQMATHVEWVGLWASKRVGTIYLPR
jgi:hypothetical protein